MSDDAYRRWSESLGLGGAGKADEDDPNTYQAFRIARDATPPLLDIRRADGTGELIPYRFLMRVSYSVLHNGTWLISLLYPSFTVLLEGQHLEELVHRLQGCEVAYLQEFDSNRWTRPETSAALISTITINTTN